MMVPFCPRRFNLPVVQRQCPRMPIVPQAQGMYIPFTLEWKTIPLTIRETSDEVSAYDTTAGVESDLFVIKVPPRTRYRFTSDSKVYIVPKDANGAAITDGEISIYVAMPNRQSMVLIDKGKVTKYQEYTDVTKMAKLPAGLELEEDLLLVIRLKSATAAKGSLSELEITGEQDIMMLA